MLLGAVAALALAGGAHADENIQGAGITRTIDCAGGEVTITGSGHNLTLTGRCPRVALSGTGSTVHVDQLGRLTVSGVNQRVEWVKSLDGGAPRIQKSGIGVEVVHVATVGGSASARRSGGTVVEAGGNAVSIGADGSVAVQSAEGGTVTATTRRGRDKDTVVVDANGTTVNIDAATGSVTVMENDQERTYDCVGGSATIQGNDNMLTLRRCSELIVNGNSNTLTLQGPVKVIRALGNNNVVTWSEGAGGQAPRVEDLGAHNKVSRSGGR